jgi:hypothetical protein
MAGATTIEALPDADLGSEATMNPAVPFLAPLLMSAAGFSPIGSQVGDAPGAERANQVRIEEHIIIRIVPRASRLDPDLLSRAANRPHGERMPVRATGRCVAVAGIAGVQPYEGNELILYMRDRRVMSGMLERACRARDFYSGFYLARSGDGKLCVDRDMLRSRSGANCKLTRIRQLVAGE